MEVQVSISEDRIGYFDYLRVIALFCVVVIHVVAEVWNVPSTSSGTFAVLNGFDSVVRWSVPAYVMISGALFLGKEKNIKSIYKKNILHLVITFLLWSVVYALCTSKGAGLYMTALTVLGGHFHMWFILMIIGMYMMLPVFYKVVEDRKLVEYILILAFVFTSLIPWLVKTAYFSNIGPLILLADVINSHVGFMNVGIVAGYIGYFFAGYYINTAEISKKTRFIIYGLGIVGFVSTFFLTRALCISIGAPSVEYYGDTTVNILMTTIAVFVFAKYELGKLKAGKFIHFLGRISLQAYMVHMLVIIYLEKWTGLNALSLNAVAGVLAVSAISYVISFGIAALVQVALGKASKLKPGKKS